jgi:ATP-dependent Clp protease ATP-binding subunit ClpA
VLFDEIEKAHPDVFNLLLQILDDGHVTDSKGRKVNFKNTVIIMTSNIGSDLILNADKMPDIGFNDGDEAQADDSVKTKVLELLQQQFRPEFLNRVDEVIFFHALEKQHIAEIVQLQVNLVSERLQNQRDIHLNVTERAKKFLAEKGYDPQFGARPLKRIIQTQILNPLAMQIIKGEVPEEANVTIDAVKDEINIRVK